jgi:predicted ArsR family transcriptional regulator
LQRKPLLSVAAAAGELNLTAPTVRSAIENLEKHRLGMRERRAKGATGSFVYSRYLDVLQQDTEESFRNS